MADTESDLSRAGAGSSRRNRSLLRRAAASLMLLSGVTHVAQLAVYDAHHSVIGAAVFGGIYFGIGVLLLSRYGIALVLGAVLPTIGGVLGIYRFLHLHPNPFSVFHVAIDLVVVPVCVYLLYLGKSGETE